MCLQKGHDSKRLTEPLKCRKCLGPGPEVEILRPDMENWLRREGGRCGWRREGELFG